VLDLGPHAVFIVAAYAVTFIAVGALMFFIIADDRRQRRFLAELERKGIRRRSAAAPARQAPAKQAARKRRA
jgi:heme exporter protein D